MKTFKHTAPKGLVPAGLGLALAAALLFMLSLVGGPVQAAPPAAPTPVANIPAPDSWQVVSFQSLITVTADRGGNALQLPGFDYADIQYVIDQGSTTNTITLTVQYSNDNANWVSGEALVSGNAADATDITRVPLFGRYTRIYQDVTNSTDVTVTVLGLVK